MSRTYRDSQGRMRTERLLFLGLGAPSNVEQPGRRLIQIHDPVAGYSYTLDVRKADRGPVCYPRA
jgi:hypothetical protein